jgi:hypothetical protein
MRKAFSLITSIFIIIMMSSVSVLVFSVSGKMAKETTIQFRKEQAMLLARSYTEFAVMAVINYDRGASNDCIENINGDITSLTPGETPMAEASTTNGSGYKVDTKIYYLGNNLPCTAANILNNGTAITTSYNDIAGKPDALAAILVDVYVQYKDPDVDNPTTSEWITYHRRTLQKI